MQKPVVKQEMVASAYRRAQAVEHLVARISGLNLHECPSCTGGTCRLHIDGNSKLHSMSLRQQRGLPSVYEFMAGSVMTEDW